MPVTLEGTDVPSLDSCRYMLLQRLISIAAEKPGNTLG
jgi:hypothetical protein